jgi:two-component sensor histidine kinase
MLSFSIRSRFSGPLGPFPFLLFFPAVIISAIVFNRGSGYVATALSAGLSAYAFLPPIGSLAIEEPSHLVGWCLYVLIGAAITTIIEAQHMAYRKLARAHANLSVSLQETAASEADKADLLREMSHRVLNNMQTVISLLHLQARVSDPNTRDNLLSAAERVGVMAKVQNRLVRSEGVTSTDAHEFITELCNDLRSALIGLRPIQLTVYAESHQVPINQVVSVGLIINELVINALKYAFPDDRAGHVSVEFTRMDNEFRLCVSDDGVGVAPVREPSEAVHSSTGLGQRIVKAFVTQLDGRLEVTHRSPGTTSTVHFPAPALVPP